MLRPTLKIDTITLIAEKEIDEKKHDTERPKRTHTHEIYFFYPSISFGLGSLIPSAVMHRLVSIDNMQGRSRKTYP